MVYIYGQDKGVALTIEGSVFKHSRFCKGMIVYRKEPTIKADGFEVLQMSSFAEPLESEDEPFILIYDSTFENLNMGTMINQL